MHLYSYSDWEACNETQTSVDSGITSDPLTGNEVIIVLDEDDEKEYANIPLSERPKRCLPKRSTNTTRKAGRRLEEGEEEEDMDIQQATREEEIFQSMSCMPSLRDKSFEELRLECYLQSRVATGQSPRPVSIPALAIPPSFAPWCQDEFDESHGSEAVNSKRVRLHQELEALSSIQPTLTSALTFGQVLMFK